MSARRSLRRHLWAPLAVGAAATVAALLLAGPPAQQAKAAPALTPQAAVGFQTTDKLVLTVNLPAGKDRPDGKLRVELVGPDGKVLDSGEQAGAARRRPDYPPLRAAFAQGGGRQGDAPLHLRQGEDGNAAGQGAAGQGPRDGAERRPGVLRRQPRPPSAARSTASSRSPRPCRCPAATVDGAARRQGRQGRHASTRARPATTASPTSEFKVPDAAGRRLQAARSPPSPTSARRSWSATCKVKTTPKVLLVTDKPLYQPGQLMHIRALALRPST